MKIFKEYIDRYESQLSKVLKQIRGVVLIRFLVFLGAAVLVYLAFKISASVGIITIIVGIAVFLMLVKKHEQLKEIKNHLNELIEINREEIRKQKIDLEGFDEGTDFMDGAHPYISDLDIFGKNSLFQYIDRSATSIGRFRLGAWLKKRSHKDEILKRQDAIKELSGQLDWRQDFLATGRLENETYAHLQEIYRWLDEKNEFYGKPLFKVLLFVLPLVMMVLIILSFFIIPANIPVVFGLLQLGMVGLFLKRINYQHAQVTKKIKLIKKYGKLFGKIESLEVKSDKLVQLKEDLKTNHKNVSDRITQLSDLISLFDNRLNMLAALFLNGFLIWDLQMVYRLEKWKLQNKPHIPEWMDILAEFDALNSFAAYAFMNPDFIYPEINDLDHTFEARHMAHPLIQTGERVPNDLEISKSGQYILITGSNMAGKSTFLRTVGVNMIIGLSGGPVCASMMKIPELQLYTSMRVGDNLASRESTFYAELKRLKAIIDEEKQQPLFILLDEILKGTNSKDKLSGSMALIRQLVKSTSIGIIATHDLDLGTLELDYPDGVLNYNFEVDIEDGQFHFDYKLKRGVCQILNATELMKSMGLEV